MSDMSLYESKYTYRQVNCIEQCSSKYCVEHKISDCNYYNEICSKQCPLECKLTHYKANVAIGPLTEHYFAHNLVSYRESLAKKFGRNFTNENVHANLLNIFIFFKDLQYTDISQIPKTTWVDLLSSIGGSLGLFLGLSLISVLQILDMIIESFFLMKNGVLLRINSSNFPR